MYYTVLKEFRVQGVYHILLYFTSCCVVHVRPNDSLLSYYLVADSIGEFSSIAFGDCIRHSWLV